MAVVGVVREREAKNPEMATGDVEVIATDLVILDEAKTPPIYIKDDDNVSDAMRLKYRYLDLRKHSLQENLKTRAKISAAFRSFLNDNAFIEVETPFLTKPTPEGARDYLVPSRINEHKFYALPQSPQLLKQLLMVSGMDRYYQIVKCFRDEDLRANRQPEFTQVDIEMSFVDIDDVIAMNEALLQHIFKEIKGIDLELPLKRMSYRKPWTDTVLTNPMCAGMELVDLSDLWQMRIQGVLRCGRKEALFAPLMPKDSKGSTQEKPFQSSNPLSKITVRKVLRGQKSPMARLHLRCRSSLTTG